MHICNCLSTCSFKSFPSVFPVLFICVNTCIDMHIIKSNPYRLLPHLIPHQNLHMLFSIWIANSGKNKKMHSRLSLKVHYIVYLKCWTNFLHSSLWIYVISILATYFFLHVNPCNYHNKTPIWIILFLIFQNLYFIIILSPAKAVTMALFQAKRSLSFLVA